MRDKYNPNVVGWTLLALAVLGLAIAIVVFSGTNARAHSWYPTDCCSNIDCREVSASDAERIIEKGDHFILWDGTKFPKAKTRFSPDGKYHKCPTCFFAPGGNG